MDKIQERIHYLIDHYFNGNKRAFASSVGVSPTVIENIVGSRQGKPSFDVLQKISLANANISTSWLLTGKGEMINSSDEKEVKILNPSHDATATQTFHTRADRDVDTQNVPLYDFGASAGLVEIFNNANILPIDTLRIPNLPPVDGAIYVRGDSMSPLLKSGDIVLYKKKELSVSSIIWGEIYLLSFVLDSDSYTAVKYIRKSEEDDMVTLASFNPDFAPKNIPIASITALALVKASISFHTME